MCIRDSLSCVPKCIHAVQNQQHGEYQYYKIDDPVCYTHQHFLAILSASVDQYECHKSTYCCSSKDNIWKVIDDNTCNRSVSISIGKYDTVCLLANQLVICCNSVSFAGRVNLLCYSTILNNCYTWCISICCSCFSNGISCSCCNVVKCDCISVTQFYICLLYTSCLYKQISYEIFQPVHT